MTLPNEDEVITLVRRRAERLERQRTIPPWQLWLPLIGIPLLPALNAWISRLQ